MSAVSAREKEILRWIAMLEEECALGEWSERRTSPFIAVHAVFAIAGFVFTGDMIWLLGVVASVIAVNWSVMSGLRAINQRQYYQDLRLRYALYINNHDY